MTNYDKHDKIKKYKTDYHVHPNYSIDALPVSIREYCQRAVELNLAEICFTTHVELDPARNDGFVLLNAKSHPVWQLNWLDNYLNEIEDAQKEFAATGLKILSGLEIGYVLGIEKVIEKIVNNFPIDYLLGAIHTLDKLNISSRNESPEYFSSKSPNEMKNDYFKALEGAVDSGLFNCIAHIDLYRRYGLKYYGSEVLTIHRGIIEPILEKIASSNMGLEINTSSLRRNSKEFHPSEEILSLAVEAGVEIFTVGSDAHCLEHLGYHIDEALAMLDNHGLQSSTYFKGRHLSPHIK